MTKKEATTIVNILLEADGGCPDCAESLLVLFVKAFPEKKHIAQERFKKKFKFKGGGYRRE